MARLHEYQGKALLAKAGVVVPRGSVARSSDEAAAAAERIGLPVVVKIQAWTTGRKSMGGVVFADTVEAVRDAAKKLLAMRVGRFVVEEVLVEQRLDLADELFVSVNIDDAQRRPVLLLGLCGGTGIEERRRAVVRLAMKTDGSVDRAALKDALESSRIDANRQAAVQRAIEDIARLARQIEARNLEVNPLAITTDGEVVAADCRMTIDDYAVFRHPELGIEIARELDHPPTRLERIAYDIEQADHRGTFYFAQLPVESGKAVIGFHGAGGGGSMMSMDAITDAGFAIANFTDTSGNPSVAKVYRAARMILSQRGIVGYFGSGSGVASQEQFHSAYGLAKAFLEMNLAIPAVIRLGGNSEDRAIAILEDACRGLSVKVAGYKKDDSPAFCAGRFAELVKEHGAQAAEMQRSVPYFVGAANAYMFPIEGGTVWINHAQCDAQTTQLVIAKSGGLFKERHGRPGLAIRVEDAARKDSELIACEIECFRAGQPVVFVDLPIAGLDIEEDLELAEVESE